MDKIYYEEYFLLERNHWWFKARREILESLIRKFNIAGNNSSILNIGAATGRTTEMLELFGTVTSVEYDAHCCTFVKEKTGREFTQASITELPYGDNSFDRVCAFDVIEHVDEHKKAMQEMWRVCKPNGVIAITVPAFMFLWSRHDEVNHHERRYTRSDLERLAAEVKSEILFSSYFNFFLFPLIAITRLLTRIFPFVVKRSGSGSDFSYSGGSISNAVFYFIMRFEKLFLKSGISFPFGVSIILFMRKRGREPMA